MSFVTNIVLVTGLVDDKNVAAANAWLAEARQPELVQVDRHADGPKAMEVDVYVGAFNYLPVTEFVEFVLGLNWRWPEEFVLIEQTEDYPLEVHRAKE